MQLYLVLLYLLAGLAAPQSNDGVFYNPPQYGPNGDFSQNPVYQIGSTVQLRWTVSWDRISMTLWQNGNNDFEYLLPNVSNPNYYNWIVSTKKDFSAQSGNNGTVFFLAAYLPGTTSPFTCRYFNITNATSGGLLSTTSGASAAPATTVTVTIVGQTIVPLMPSKTAVLVTVPPSTSAVSTTIVATSLLLPPSTVPSSPAPTATNVDVQLDTGQSSSTKIGMGVGIGVGVPALIALGAFVGWILRASTRRREPSTMSYETRHSWLSLGQHRSPYRPKGVHEAPGPFPAYELPPVASPRGSIRYF